MAIEHVRSAGFEEEVELDLRQLWQGLMRRKWVVLLLFFTAATVAFFVSNAMTPIYEATTTVLVKESRSALTLPFFEDFAGGSQSQVQTSVEIFRSRTVAWNTVQRLGYDWEIHSDEFEEFRENISVQPVTGTNIIRISALHPDPVEAQRIANGIVETFIEISQAMNAEDVRSAREFIEEQLERFAAELEAAEEELVRFREQERVVTPSGETQATLQTLARLDSLKAEALVNRQAAEERLRALQGDLAPVRRDVLSEAVIENNPVIHGIRQRLVDLEGQRAALLERFTERHPQVLQLDAQIEQLHQELEREIARLQATNPDTQLTQEAIILQAEILAESARLEAVDALIGEQEALLIGLPEKELQLARLIRNASVTEAIYTMLRERYEEMRITEAMETATVTVIDPAIAPKEPVRPRKMLNVAIAGFLGIFVGVGLAFLLEYLDTSFKSPEEIEAYLGLPLLGRTPLYDEHALASASPNGSGRQGAYRRG